MLGRGNHVMRRRKPNKGTGRTYLRQKSEAALYGQALESIGYEGLWRETSSETRGGPI